MYLESLGCAGNRTDSSRVLGLAGSNGFEVTNDPRSADYLVVMTCGFTATHEQFSLERIRHLARVKQEHARIVVGGCLPDIARKTLSDLGIALAGTFGPRALEEVLELLEAPSSVAQKPWAQVEDGSYLLRISTGCLSRCSYCAIRFATGSTKSKASEQVLEEMRVAQERGFRKVTLVSEDVGAWGADLGASPAALLRQVLEMAERLDMLVATEGMSPIWFRKHFLGQDEVVTNRRWVSPLVLPLQSGSDRILGLMRRGHSRSDVEEILEYLGRVAPWRSLSTDLIVGFPSETEADFLQTRELLSRFEFAFSQLFAYHDRPGIDSATLVPKVPENEKHSRLLRLLLVVLDRHLQRTGGSFQQMLDEISAGRFQLPVNVNVSFAHLGLPIGSPVSVEDRFQMWVPSRDGTRVVRTSTGKEQP